MSSFSFLPKKDPKSSLLALIRSRVAIAIAPHFHTQLCTILTTLATKVARYLGIIFSRWFVFSRGIFVVLIDFNTARSVYLTKGYCIQWGNCKPGGRGGMIYTLGNLWRGRVLHGSSNPDNISDPKSSCSTPIFRPERRGGGGWRVV